MSGFLYHCLLYTSCPDNKEFSVSGDKVDFIISKDKFDDPVVEESYCWTIWNKNREVELFSGFNSFYGTGSKTVSYTHLYLVQR